MRIRCDDEVDNMRTSSGAPHGTSSRIMSSKWLTERWSNKPRRRCLKGISRSLLTSGLVVVATLVPSLLIPSQPAHAFFNFVVSPQSCYIRNASDARLLKRNKSSISNNSRTKSIQVLCGLLGNFDASPSSDCDNGSTSNYDFNLRATVRMRPEWSRDEAKIKLVKVASSKSRSPSSYSSESSVTPREAGWDRESRYVAADMQMSLGCRQLDDTGAAVVIDAWATQAIVTLPPGGQLTVLNYFGGQ